MFHTAKFHVLLKSSGGGGFFANASDFDGTNDYTTRGAGLTGAADGKQGTLSLWVRFDGGDAVTQYLINGTTSVGGGADRFVLLKTTGNLFEVQGKNAAGTIILRLRSTATYTAGATWLNFLSSWDLATAARHIYVNDGSDLTVVTFTDDTLDYTVADWSVGASTGGLVKSNACFAEVLFHNSYIDLSSEANRRLFISATGKPVNLGADGSTPLGVQPLVYFKNPAASFGTNSGSGGDFTITGTLDTASTSPSD